MMGSLRTVLAKGVYWGLYTRCRRGFFAHVRASLADRQTLQWQSPEQIRERQLLRLQQLLGHAAKHVPYYRHLHAQGRFPDYIDSLEQMASVPIVTKELIRAAPEEFLADGSNPDRLLKKRSGGSSGEPLSFYVTPTASVEAAASEIWADSLAGYRLGDPVAVLWGSHFDEPPRKSFRERAGAYVGNRLTIVSDRLDEPRLAEIHARFRDFHPRILLGYANAVGELAAYLERRGHLSPGFPSASIITAAEALPEAKRKMVQRVFGRPVFDRYGAREVGLVAMECEQHRGLHVDCESLHVDVEPCPGAPEGRYRILATRLHEYGMPFIRYDLGDYTTAPPGWCSCGRGSPTIERVCGRQISMLRLKDGTAIAGEVFIALLDFEPLRQYRVVQEADYSVRIDVVPDAGYDADHEAKIMWHLQRIIRNEIPIRIEVREAIPLTESGKLLPVISHVKAIGRDG